MAWQGRGPFLRHGYFIATAAYLKGHCEAYPLDAQQCYAIVNTGTLRSATQFQLVPIDQRGTVLGPAVVQMSCHGMAGLWQHGLLSTSYDISDHWLA